MRVAVNAEQLLYRSPGGIGRYTAALLTLLPAGWPDLEVVPFTARHPTAQVAGALREAGVEEPTLGRAVVLGWPRPLLYDSWHLLGRPGLGRAGNVQLIHAPSVAVPPAGRVPLVVTVHDAAPELFPEAFPRRGRRFHRWGLAAAADRADLVITVSSAAADEIVAHSAIRADRIRVVPNAVAGPVVEAELRRRVLQAHGLDGRRYVLWVGSLEPRKGVGTLVAAMASLARRGKGERAWTVLAGFDGWLGDDLIAPGDRAALGDSLVQLGRISDEVLWCLYSGATLFGFPSRHEGFGLPVIEAMTQGAPVVASDIPAVREVAGDAAVLVAPEDPVAWADALEGLLDDEATRARMSLAGRERSGHFSVDRWVESTRAVYQEIGS